MCANFYIGCRTLQVQKNEQKKELEMRPYVICHMLSSIDGRIDGASLRDVMGSNDYEVTGSKLKGDAWACGRTTMQLHFADKKPFVSKSRKPAGPRPVYVAHRAKSYAISIDTLGKLRWSRTDIGGDHLICVVSERAPEEYLVDLQKKGISYIVSGKRSVDLSKAMKLLGKYFGIKTLLLEGGGNINGGFLDANLVDEVSLLLAPGIDGRHEVPALFDGVNARSKRAVPLKLKSVEQRKSDILWIRYKVIRKRK